MEEMSNTDLVEKLFELKNRIRAFKQDIGHISEESLKNTENLIKDIEKELETRGVKQI